MPPRARFTWAITALLLISTCALADDGGFDIDAYNKAEAAKQAKIQSEAAARERAKKQAAKKKREAAAKAQAEKDMQPENVAKKTDTDICLRAGDAYRAADHKAIGVWGTEAAKRTVFRNQHINAIKAKHIGIGMSECEMLASQGMPERYNRSVTAAGTRIQYVYPGRLYIYTDNGIVTAWQD